jgi:hypothetical protein
MYEEAAGTEPTMQSRHVPTLLFRSRRSRVLDFGTCLSVVATFLACKSEAYQHGDQADASVISPTVTRTVTSMIQLIATPERYHGRFVVLRGYWVTSDHPEEWGRGRLHINKEDAERDLGTAVELHFVPCDQKIRRDKPVTFSEARKLNGRYVSVWGEWYSPTGSDLSGSVCSISFMRDVSEEGWTASIDGADGGGADLAPRSKSKRWSK